MFYVFNFKMLKIVFLIAVIIGLAFLAVFAVYPEFFLKFFYPMYYEDYIRKYAQEYDIDPMLIAAIIKVESKFIPGAISSKGARGLMQIMPETGKWAAQQLKIKEYKATDLFDPETNIRIGTWYLNQLKKEFNNDLDLMLAAYNGGQGNVKKWIKEEGDAAILEKIPFNETKQFVLKVKKAYTNYKRIYN